MPHNDEQNAAGKVILFAAGSLSQAFKEAAHVVRTVYDIHLELECGSTARMAKLIEEGMPCDIFAAADMATPQNFVDAGKAKSVIPFIRNDIVAVTRKGSGITALTLPEFLTAAAPASIGISDPATQPCGANACRALGAVMPEGRLKQTVHIVTGGLDKKKEKEQGEKSDYTLALENGLDLLILFRTTAHKICAQSEQAEMIDLPAPMRVTAHYGMILLNDKDETGRIGTYLQSQAAKQIFQKYGFQ